MATQVYRSGRRPKISGGDTLLHRKQYNGDDVLRQAMTEVRLIGSIDFFRN